ncbi:MAG: CrcB family protein [Microthrixaceae bacterium]
MDDDPDRVTGDQVTADRVTADRLRGRTQVHRGHTPRFEPDVLAVIALGGMIGATCRYALSRALPSAAGRFPWATLITNLTGSLILAVLLVVMVERFPPSRLLRPFLTTGVLGAYTTMSTFLVDTALLIEGGHALTGFGYALSTLVGGLALAYLGVSTTRRIYQNS